MELQDLLRELDELCPFCLQEDFDNSGLQLGKSTQVCERVLLCLDFTEAVLKEAREKKVDTIISHHPFLFQPLKSIDSRNWQGKMIYELIESKIALIALHTNLDKIHYGVNMKLAADLGLTNVEVLVGEAKRADWGLGAVGELAEAISFARFCAVVRHKLKQPCLRTVGEGTKKVQRIALLGGGGSEYFEEALAKNADVYLSSDFKYHDAQKAHNLGFCLIDGGHFHTEVGVIENLKAELGAKIPALKLIISANLFDYWQYNF